MSSARDKAVELAKDLLCHRAEVGNMIDSIIEASVLAVEESHKKQGGFGVTLLDTGYQGSTKPILRAGSPVSPVRPLVGPGVLPEAMKPTRDAVDRLHRILHDPHPGLQTWLFMVTEAGQDLMDTLVEAGFSPVDPEGEEA